MRYRMALALALLLPACGHDLQRPYVEEMERVRRAVERDVRRGRYLPDALGARNLLLWREANAAAFMRLIERERETLPPR